MARRTPPPVPAAAAAGAAVVAGALAAGKVARDRVRSAHIEQERAFRLDGEEPAADGLRRIARGQIDDAADRLHDARNDGAAIHDVRKDLKRLRAVVRLARDDLGRDVYRHENTAFRDAGRDLSGARDAKVLVETLDDLTRRHADEIPEGAFAGLREQLDGERAEHDRRAADDPVLSSVLAALEEARGRVAAWPLTEDAGYETLKSGFKRIRRRGRRALRAARKKRSEETLHELRKRAKDLWHAAQILGPVAPKRMKRIRRRAHRLSDLIGAEHDLAVLRAAAAKHRDTLSAQERELLRGLIRRRRRRLRRQALRRARKLYA
jgi:CHAD domain-containing protein